MSQMAISEGQCGLCTHFGEHHSQKPQLIQLRRQRAAPDDLIEECSHPAHAPLHLVVTPISGCVGFEMATEAFAQ